ncbi:hypothetical protein V525_06320 [Gordonia alkanivorans CGMCC 6845]|uniref:Uncharacterized protein n=1 Tax=Gordonia alkanivorans CGMCC 6845 TaxID=1423140 RepID=W9DHA8_9ACTN|nr:hypothetical protein V525_06320 [Gordonia alkanivorans CGMCC 6845]
MWLMHSTAPPTSGMFWTPVKCRSSAWARTSVFAMISRVR